MLQFFSASENNEEASQVSRFTSTDIAHILSSATVGSLFILDIDDTVGRVSTSIGLDAWFRFRMQQFINEGHSQSEALRDAIILYNLAQLASKTMVPVDEHNPIAPLIAELKMKGAKVIGLTARNHKLTDKTLELLGTLGVTFSADVLPSVTFMLNEKPVVMKDGVIFANGNHKGKCLEFAQELGHISLSDTYANVHFADDSKSNCDHVAESLIALKIQKSTVWHYTFAEEYLKFSEDHKARAAVQEGVLTEEFILLTDNEADERLSLSAPRIGSF